MDDTEPVIRRRDLFGVSHVVKDLKITKEIAFKVMFLHHYELRFCGIELELHRMRFLQQEYIGIYYKGDLVSIRNYPDEMSVLGNTPTWSQL